MFYTSTPPKYYEKRPHATKKSVGAGIDLHNCASVRGGTPKERAVPSREEYQALRISQVRNRLWKKGFQDHNCHPHELFEEEESKKKAALNSAKRLYSGGCCNGKRNGWSVLIETVGSGHHVLLL